MAEKVKNLPAIKEILGGSLDQKDPLEEEKVTHSVFLPGEFHGQRSLVGCSSWGRRESDTTGLLTF